MRYLPIALLILALVGCAARPDFAPITSTPDEGVSTIALPPVTPEQPGIVTPPAPATAPPATASPFDQGTNDPASPPVTPGLSPTEASQATALYLPLAPRGEAPTPTAPPATAPPAPSSTAVPPTQPPPSPTVAPPPPTEVLSSAASPPEGAPVMELRGDLPAMTLRDWPRPAGDNGRCMHFLKNQYFTQEELDLNVQRLQQLGAKWTLVVYADENQIKMAAPRFAEAGIVPIWRKMLRAHQAYYDWERDVKLVQSYGLPPYFQLYNEPSLSEEWKDGWEGPSDERLFLDNLMQATRDVYNAGGYVGWQFVSPHWLDHAIDEVQRQQGEKVFERFFFIPHPYGENLPPDWTADGRGVLSYRYFADQLERRLGFKPMMIAGEGGWRINSDVSPDFPPINDTLHRQYHVELFNWFRTGVVSDGEPLPDEFFAYCVWLIAARGDDNAWWDSFAGNRQATIDAISAMPPFERRFSWER